MSSTFSVVPPVLANYVSVLSTTRTPVFMGLTPVESPTAGAERDELAVAVAIWRVVGGARVVTAGNIYSLCWTNCEGIVEG